MNKNIYITLAILFYSISCNVLANDGKEAILEKELIERFNLIDYSCSIEEQLDSPSGTLIKFTAKNENDQSLQIYVGLALWADKQKSFIFINPDAFFCRGCNNESFQSVSIDQDKLTIGISWGPSVNPQYDSFTFRALPEKKDWLLISISNNDIDTVKYKRYVSNYDAESAPYDDVIYLRKYASSDIPKVAYMLKNTKNIDDLIGRFTEKDASDLVESINKNNVQLANDCGYYLEQLGMLDEAIVILEKIVSVYPNRMVAYLNLGDAYSKKHMYYQTEAKEAYEKYVTLMNQRGLREKIPDRVIEYLDVNE